MIARTRGLSSLIWATPIYRTRRATRRRTATPAVHDRYLCEPTGMICAPRPAIPSSNWQTTANVEVRRPTPSTAAGATPVSAAAEVAGERRYLTVMFCRPGWVRRQRPGGDCLLWIMESILFGSSPLEAFAIDNVGTTPNEMPGVYTRSKLAAEQRALQAAASGFPVVIANPTMPIGPHYGNLTPPTLMLRYFINRRIQLYFDFILNLVDVRDVAAGLLLAMERGQSGHRYILGGEAISLGKVLSAVGAITGRKAFRVPIPAEIARTTAAVMEFVSDHVTHRPPAGTVEEIRVTDYGYSIPVD